MLTLITLMRSPPECCSVGATPSGHRDCIAEATGKGCPRLVQVTKECSYFFLQSKTEQEAVGCAPWWIHDQGLVQGEWSSKTSSASGFHEEKCPAAAFETFSRGFSPPPQKKIKDRFSKVAN